MLISFILLLSVLGLLIGGELLVSSSSKIALRLGMSSLLVGLTVVAFGTSAPELFISIQASLEGKGDIAIGNVVGSNICNTLLIIGVCALVAPLSVPSQLIRRELPIMFAASLLLLILGLDLEFSRVDGLILVSCLFGFLFFSVQGARREKRLNKAKKEEEDLESSDKAPMTKSFLLVIVSLVLLAAGSKGFVHSASEIARWLGVSELVIGLTIVALGTSLPEVVTSVVATYRGQRDLAVGNVVGSNIFNILCVLGFCSAITPLQVPLAALSFDIPIMVFSALACIPIIYIDKLISRMDGLFLFAMYVLYILFLVLINKEHANVPVIGEIMLAFVLPLIALTLKSLTVKRGAAVKSEV